MSEIPDEPLAPGLYLVSTPIGNLEDITLRALRVLRSADRIACEDTRQTRKLLDRYGITTPSVSSHEHNEAHRSHELIDQIKNGSRIAVVSDAGTPGISDPGMVLVAAAIAEGVPVYPIPGASAAMAALVGSGLNTEQFIFLGFPPPKAGARRTLFEELAGTLARPTTLVLYEAPHRILETLSDVEAVWGEDCRIVVARELTKLHEEFLRGSVRSVHNALTDRENVRGEMVLLMEARPRSAESFANTSITARLAELVAGEGVSEKDGLKRIARERSVSKSDIWRELQRERARR